MHRFFVSPDAVSGEQIHLHGQAAHQLSRVLRVSAGTQVLALDNRGFMYQCRVATVSPHDVTLQVSEKTACTPCSLMITLYQAMPKGDKFEWIIQKATELGVARIQPLVTARCISKWEPARGEAKLARWHAIAQEAAEQCERPDIPIIGAPVSLGAALDDKPGTALVLAERGSAVPFARALPAALPARGLGIYVGPEGGWDPQEREQMRSSGCVEVSLGARILRTETAGLAALAIAQSTYDWPG